MSFGASRRLGRTAWIKGRLRNSAYDKSVELLPPRADLRSALAELLTWQVVAALHPAELLVLLVVALLQVIELVPW